MWQTKFFKTKTSFHVCEDWAHRCCKIETQTKKTNIKAKPLDEILQNCVKAPNPSVEVHIMLMKVRGGRDSGRSRSEDGVEKSMERWLYCKGVENMTEQNLGGFETETWRVWSLRASSIVPGSASGNEKWPPSRIQMHTHAKLSLNLHCILH